MNRLASFVLLAAVASVLQAQVLPITGMWKGEAIVKGQQVPLTLEISGTAGSLKAALLNGPESSSASRAVLTGDHLVLTFDYYARTIEAKVDHDQLVGSFDSGTSSLPLTLRRSPVSQSHGGDLTRVAGDWEVAVHSVKGESAWQLHVAAPAARQPAHAVIQRIDGDTGSLFGSWNAETNVWRFSHFTAAGPALYSLAPQSNETLLVSNLLNDQQTNLVARRPAEARMQNLALPTDPTRQTTIKDPADRFRFSFPDLSGKIVSNTDPQFEGKVVIVAVGGSWCPNCHDEAPLLESLYKQFHARGLEVVNLSFEEADQLKEPTRLHAFIERYGITYTVLVAGEPSQLNEKITQANGLNCWPTSFFLGRDGRVKEIHAGFAGPANQSAHEQLVNDVTALVERLLAEAVPTQNASR